MTLDDQTPTYNLSVVVHETGLKPDTLRVWEKRYGLPQPQRTPGGHRLYSRHDIEMLRWLVARKTEGLTIRRAVDLWRQIEASGQDPLQASSAIDQTNITPNLDVSLTRDRIIEARRAWTAACIAFDEQTAEHKLAEAFALYSPEVVCTEVLQKGLAEIGEGWYQGQISVQQEHFASALAMRRLQTLVASTPPATRTGLILIGCPPEENHSFSPLLLTFLLRRQGWSVTYLGANVPLLKMEETLAILKPQLVVLSAQHLYTAATLSQMAHLLQGHKVSLAFGGGVFSRISELQSRIPGHFLGNDLTKAVQTIERLIATSPTPSIVASLSVDYQKALSAFQERQTKIETDLWQTIASLDMSTSQLTVANRELARTICAALILGDITLANTVVTWVEGLLHNQPRPQLAGQLSRYLAAYHRAAQASLDQRGALILDWLEQLK